MKNGLRVAAFFCFSFLLIFTASAVVQSTWVKLTSDNSSVVKETVTAEVNKQESFSLPEQATSNFKNVQREKDDEDAAYKADVRSVTGEFTRTKQKRDVLTTQFQGKSQELEEIQKTIQTLKKGIENYNSNIARFAEDIKSQQLSLEKWLKTEKQGEAAVAVIYTRGFKDVAHDLEKLADQASAPLLAESMGVKIRSHSQVINNVLAKDIVQATVEGTSKPVNEEPSKLELDKPPAGTVYLRLKRYELFPFQYPAEGRVKPAKEAGRFKARIVTSGADLEAFLKASGYSPSKGDLVRLQRVIEDAMENNRTAESSLGSQIETYQSRIKQYREKIEDQRAEKGKDEKKLTREQESYQKLKGQAAAAETAKGNAEREFQQAQVHLQEKKRVRETIIFKDARAVPKGSEAPAHAVAAVIIDKLEEVRNDAKTQHSTATTTVVNNQIASEQAGQAVTDARILAVRLISFVNEGESGVRVQIAFRVRTVLSDVADTPRQTAGAPPTVSKPAVVGPAKTSPAGKKESKKTKAQVAAGAIKVESTPAGAQVYVNGRYNADAPAEITGLKSGKYKIEIRLEGYKPWHEQMTYQRGQVLEVAAILEKIFIPETEPLPSPAKRPSQPTDGGTTRDGRFIAYNNGTVLDTKTGLMWASKDNGSIINWANAKSYCENYRGGGYSDWRMPTQDELAGLYDAGKSYKATQWDYNVKLTELIQLSTCCPWASETRGSEAAYFYFYSGERYWTHQSGATGTRALPVRSGK